MKKSLFRQECIDALAARVQKLTPATAPLWGTMTATEMLLHCNRINENLLTTPPPPQKKPTAIRQYIVRILALYLLPNLPKNIRAPKRLITSGQINTSEFDVQQTLFTSILQRFPTHQNSIALPHPFFGNLSTKQWGLAGWKHVNHHLKQFGV